MYKGAAHYSGQRVCQTFILLLRSAQTTVLCRESYIRPGVKVQKLGGAIQSQLNGTCSPQYLPDLGLYQSRKST